MSGAQHVKQSLAEFRVRRRKISLIVFSGGMCVGKNSSQPANVLVQSTSETVKKASLRTSDRCHWCGNPSFFHAFPNQSGGRSTDSHASVRNLLGMTGGSLTRWLVQSTSALRRAANLLKKAALGRLTQENIRPEEVLTQSSAVLDGSFAAAYQFQSLEIHKVFLRLCPRDLRQNLSPIPLAD